MLIMWRPRGLCQDSLLVVVLLCCVFVSLQCCWSLDEQNTVFTLQITWTVFGTSCYILHNAHCMYYTLNTKWTITMPYVPLQYTSRLARMHLAKTCSKSESLYFCFFSNSNLWRDTPTFFFLLFALDTILSTVRAVTRKRRAELAHR